MSLEAAAFSSPQPAEIPAQPMVMAGRWKSPLPLNTTTMLYRMLCGVLFVLTFWFGGVHPQISLPTQALFLFIAAWLTYRFSSSIRAYLSGCPVSRLVLLLLTGLLLFASLSSVARAFFHQSHPILGSAAPLPDWITSFEALGSLVFFLLVFTMTRIAAIHSEEIHGFRRALVLLGALASLTALAHWFSDNGMLFWSFAPESVFVTNRARWPFVNSNHLAHYLIPCFFVALSLLLTDSSEIRAQLAPSRRRQTILDRFLMSKRLQYRSISLVVLSVVTIAMGVAIFATLSRGSWLGVSVGLVTLLGLYTLTARSGPTPPAGVSITSPPLIKGSHSQKRSPRRSSRRPLLPAYLTSPRTFNLIALALAAVIFFSFLNQRGAELVSKRLDCGLLHSKDDIRWQFYSDTLPMLREHLLFGVGLGNWASEYPRYMNNKLAGINPVYLHSDPLQLLVELGIVGISLALAIVVIVVRYSLRALRHSQNPGQRLAVIGLLSGLAALLVVSCFDFPFRVPSLQLLVAINLGILCAILDRSELSSSLNPTPEQPHSDHRQDQI